MTLQNTIQQVRNSSTKIKKGINGNGRIPVITMVEYEKDKFDYGIQFWTRKMIDTGVVKNNDNTVSKFIEIL